MALTAQLTGNIGRDPEVRFFDNGNAVATFSVAVKQPGKKDQATGEWVDQPPFWVKVEIWGKAAQAAADQLKKGDLVFVVGDGKLEEFTKRDGTPGTAFVVKFARCEKLKSAGDGQAPRQAAPAPAPVTQAAQSLATATAGSVVDYQDDIPF
jgi:single-strand DNA-binding protein